MIGAPLLATGDNWIGLVLLIIFALMSGLSKLMQKKPEDEEQMPEEMPLPPRRRPPPPAHTPRRSQAPPPVIVVPPRHTPEAPEVTTVERELESILAQMERRSRQARPPPLPPPVEEPDEPVRRLVDARVEKEKLPSALQEQPPHREVLPSSRPEPVPHAAVLPSAQSQGKPSALTPTVAPASRARHFREQLRRRETVREAIIQRELIGPPLALREDW
jgi:hypothetical protein